VAATTVISAPNNLLNVSHLTLNSPVNWHILECINDNYKLPCKQRKKSSNKSCSELTLHVLLHGAHRGTVPTSLNQSRDSGATVTVTNVHALCSEHGYPKQLLEVTSWHEHNDANQLLPLGSLCVRRTGRTCSFNWEHVWPVARIGGDKMQSTEWVPVETSEPILMKPDTGGFRGVLWDIFNWLLSV